MILTPVILPLCTVIILYHLNSIKMGSRARGMGQAVEHLPCKCEALSSNPSTTQINK
jgi:hypothetical protein